MKCLNAINGGNKKIRRNHQIDEKSSTNVIQKGVLETTLIITKYLETVFQNAVLSKFILREALKKKNAAHLNFTDITRKVWHSHSGSIHFLCLPE